MIVAVPLDLTNHFHRSTLLCFFNLNHLQNFINLCAILHNVFPIYICLRQACNVNLMYIE